METNNWIFYERSRRKLGIMLSIILCVCTSGATASVIFSWIDDPTDPARYGITAFIVVAWVVKFFSLFSSVFQKD